MRWYSHRYHSPLSLRVVFATIPRLPRFVHPAIACLTALAFMALVKRERRNVASNLRVVTGRRGGWRLWWDVYRVFYGFCDFIVSYCYVPNATHAQLLGMLSEPDYGAKTIEAALEGGRGLVVWTAHVANWEFASRLLELHGRRVNVARVVEPGNPAERRLRDLMTNDRLRPVDMAEPLAVASLFARLRAGEIVAMQGDRVYGARSVTVPFFGRPTSFPTGALHLAHAAGVAVLPGFVVRTGWLRYQMVVCDPLPLDVSAPRDAAVRHALGTAVALLEAHLRRWPAQWLNFYEFWSAQH